MWQDIVHELFLGFPEPKHMTRVAVRLAVAAVLGGLLGLERQLDGKRDSVRTYALVALGAALFTLIGVESLSPDGTKPVDLTRIVQGLATGVGFLGAGTILKLGEQHEVRGLTTAAGIWLTAALGMAVGAGWVWPAVLGVVFAWIILYAMHSVEGCFRPPHAKKEKTHADAPPAHPKATVPEGDD